MCVCICIVCVFRIAPFVKAQFGKSFVERMLKIQGVKGQDNLSFYVKNNVTHCLVCVCVYVCNSGLLPFLCHFWTKKYVITKYLAIDLTVRKAL